MNQQTDYEKTSRNTVRQVAKRAEYDRETVFGILDENLIGHVGLVSAEGPTVVPMLFARRDDQLLFHGATKSRLMQMLCGGSPLSISVTSLDGLVLAKSLFHHSMNYRSVCVFGTGFEINEPNEKLDALKSISDKVMPGRWGDARLPNAQEMKATSVAAVQIESASAKVRSGGPSDDKEDAELSVWAGTLPIKQIMTPPIDAELSATLICPDYVNHWISKFNRDGEKFLNNSESTGRHPLGDIDPYVPRKTRPLGTRQVQGWNLKLYSISTPLSPTLDEGVIEAALAHAESHVGWPRRDSGYGFVTIHFGTYIWLLVDLWVDDILRHFLFRSTYDDPKRFVDGPPDGSNMCVWEMEVAKHERDAWVKHVLQVPLEPDFDSYLRDTLEIPEPIL